MTLSADFEVTVGPVRAIPVPATSSGGRIISGPCTLYGWSLQDTGLAVPFFKAGTVTSPGAGATIVNLGTVPAGDYTLDVDLELQGTVAAADANNFELTGPPGGPYIFENLGAVGQYPQAPVNVNLPSPTLLVVKAIALATVGAIYTAEVTATPEVGIGSAATLADGNNLIGALTVGAGQTDTKWFGPMGVMVLNQITLAIQSGQLQGAVFVGYSD